MTDNREAPYPEVDPEELGDYYLRHVDMMTTLGLRAKSDIAGQLAWRDREIDGLRARLAGLPAPLPPQSDERALFEKWFVDNVSDDSGLLVQNSDGEYIFDDAHDRWSPWQARAAQGVGHQAGTALSLHATRKESDPLPRMRAAFRTTQSCGPDKRYEMVFAFPSMEALHAADDEWQGRMPLAEAARLDEPCEVPLLLERQETAIPAPVVDLAAPSLQEHATLNESNRVPPQDWRKQLFDIGSRLRDLLPPLSIETANAIQVELNRLDMLAEAAQASVEPASLPKLPTPDWPAEPGAYGQDRRANRYSGNQMLSYGRACANAQLAPVRVEAEHHARNSK